MQTERNRAPTKTNLLRQKEELGFALVGHELLDQKRRILIMELLHLLDQALVFEHKAEETLKEAHRVLRETLRSEGKKNIFSLTGSIGDETDIRLNVRKVMGVKLPLVRTETKKKPSFSLPEGRARILRVREMFFRALKLMGELAQLEVSVIRLAREVKKTVRKVNALEKIAVPDLRETLKIIESRLEENERDMFILMKNVKNRLGEKND